MSISDCMLSMIRCCCGGYETPGSETRNMRSPPPEEPAPIEMDQNKGGPSSASAPSPGEEVVGGVYKRTSPFQALVDDDEGEILCVMQIHEREKPRSSN